jgi:hypothetical protein
MAAKINAGMAAGSDRANSSRKVKRAHRVRISVLLLAATLRACKAGKVGAPLRQPASHHGGVVVGNNLGPALCSPGLSGRALALRSSPTLPLVLPRADKWALSGCAGEFRANPEFFDLSHVPIEIYFATHTFQRLPPGIASWGGSFGLRFARSRGRSPRARRSQAALIVSGLLLLRPASRLSLLCSLTNCAATVSLKVKI